MAQEESNTSESPISIKATLVSNRSASYPSIDLEEALSRLTSLKDAIGVNGQFNRETITSAIGYKSISGASGRAVAALVHYGLLNREKDMYSLSPIGQKYLMPTQESEEFTAVKEAVLEPKLFKQIYEDYKGQVLPRQLNNILTVKHGIQTKVAPAVVKLIESSFRHAGVIGENNLLISFDKDVDVNSVVGTNPESALPNPASSQQVTPITIPTPAFSADDSNEPGMSQQTVSHSGPGWSINVLLGTSRRFDADVRKKIREFVASAEDLSDALYGVNETDESKEE